MGGDEIGSLAWPRPDVHNPEKERVGPPDAPPSTTKDRLYADSDEESAVGPKACKDEVRTSRTQTAECLGGGAEGEEGPCRTLRLDALPLLPGGRSSIGWNPAAWVRPLLPVLARVFDMALQGGGAKGINFIRIRRDEESRITLSMVIRDM